MSNRRSKLYRTLSLFVVLILVAGAAAGPIMSNVEQPKYKTVTSDGPIEIREYEPIIAAEVDVTGERFAAIREGFRVMAVYIFGDNKPRAKIAMTAPVEQQSQKIAMTAPFTRQSKDGNSTVRFIMPKS
jgi:phosphatidylserine decarboxylase